MHFRKRKLNEIQKRWHWHVQSNHLSHVTHANQTTNLVTKLIMQLPEHVVARDFVHRDFCSKKRTKTLNKSWDVVFSFFVWTQFSNIIYILLYIYALSWFRYSNSFANLQTQHTQSSKTYRYRIQKCGLHAGTKIRSHALSPNKERKKTYLNKI